MSAPRHPAKYSDPIIDAMARIVTARAAGQQLTILDPFAGTGRIHRLARCKGVARTIGIEIEPEWASMHPDTICADSIEWMRARARRGGSGRVDLVATSPCYGNRFADHHNAQDGSSRRSYAHDLGRLPTPGSSAVMPWGPRYWTFHATAYRTILSILKPHGWFILNVSDFYRQKELVHAVEWHHGAAIGAGFEIAAGQSIRWITTARHGHGANRDARAAAEAIIVLRRPA